MTECEYIQQLKKHDWYWYQSDDPRTLTKGLENERLLTQIYLKQPTYKKHFFRYQKIFNPSVYAQRKKETPAPKRRNVQ